LTIYSYNPGNSAAHLTSLIEQCAHFTAFQTHWTWITLMTWLKATTGLYT